MKRVNALRTVLGLAAWATLSAASALAGQQDAAPGQLCIVQKNGQLPALCPLKHTKVDADISGFGARVVVVQSFVNPTQVPIEAVYTFPLPHEAAVDRMRMKVGDRIVEGEIKRREEAQAIYEAAKNAGQVASLLDQERPNIFTQSVANIMPGAKVEIEISYVQLLKYEEGQFEFDFPMVVGPRYTANAPDPGKIFPPITPEGTRTGANIELAVTINAGAPIVSMKSVLHDVDIKGTPGQATARVSLRKESEIPNRDFILRYRTATDSVQSAFITQMDQSKGGFFQLVLLPPKAVKPAQIASRDIVFVIDHSGSQQGFPIEKTKELMSKLVDTLRAGDTFNVMIFSNDYSMLWKTSRPASEENVAEAKAFIRTLQGTGGTEMLNALHAAMASFDKDSGRMPIMLFSTDGLVGDEADILKAVREERGDARIFTFGIGNSVNRYFIDALATEGRGDSEYVTLAEQADPAVQRLTQRLESPVLTDVEAHFEGVDVTEQLPARIPDVFSDKPIMISGRYQQGGKGELVLSGKLGGAPWAERIPVDFGTSSNAPAIPTLWARRKVDDLTSLEPYTATDDGKSTARDSIIDTALQFGIMSAYTSFVAVEKRIVNIGGRQRLVAVPVEMADGVSYEGIFGRDKANLSMSTSLAVVGQVVAGKRGGGGGGFGGGGYGGGIGGGAGGRGGAPGHGGSGGGTVTLGDQEREVQQVTVANGQKVTDQAKAINYTRKVAKKLHDVKGPVEIQILLKALDDENVKKLTDLGFKVADSDKGLKVVFGTCDAKILLDLAQLDCVKLISPL